MKDVYEKLFYLQQEIGGIQKTESNPFFKSKYFDINQLIKQLQPLLNKHNLLLLQPLVTNEFQQNGVETQIIDFASGSVIRSFAKLPEEKDPQKMGSAITYYRRYTLQSLLGLQAEDDDGNKASGKSKGIESWQMTKIDSLIHSSTIQEDEKVGIESKMKGFSFERANQCISYLQDNQQKSLTEEFKEVTDGTSDIND